jgi:hypothetical protein
MASNPTPKLLSTYDAVFQASVTLAEGIDQINFDIISDKIQYIGFDAKAFALKHQDYITDPKKAEHLSCLVTLIVQRGTNRDKMMRTMTPAGKEILNGISTAFGINWSRERTATSVTPARILLAFPWYTVLALKKVKSTILTNYPWMFRHSAVCSVIQKENKVAKKVAIMASFTLSSAVSKEAPKTCFLNAEKFCNVGFNSDLVPEVNKISFAENFKEFKEKMDAIAKEYDRVKATYDPLPPPLSGAGPSNWNV